MYVEDDIDHKLLELGNLLGICPGDLAAHVTNFQTWLDLVWLLLL